MKNALEKLVVREYDRLAPTVSDFCGCDMCRDDVLALALNHLTPIYVAQRKGEIITSVVMETEQQRADVSVALLDAFRRVHAEPRVGHM